jgi:hypothetical protein
MFTRRVALFLLGIWIGCCLLVDFQALQRNRVATRVLDNPAEQARTDMLKAGPEASGRLLRHLAGEQVRDTLTTWEQAQYVIGAAMILLLVFSAQRKPIAIGMCGLMTLLVFVQHQMITPELSYVGRALDFTPEAASFSLATRSWTLTQMYTGSEVVKLLAGGALASYFFAMESVVKRRKSRSKSSSELETPVRSL